MDVLLAIEELAGFALSNRPRQLAATPHRTHPAALVLLAERFPGHQQDAVPAGVRIEAVRRSQVAHPHVAYPQAAYPQLAYPIYPTAARIDYLEDDGTIERVVALAELLGRHPLRCARDLVTQRDRRGDSAPRLTLRALAPAVRRLARDPGARIAPLSNDPREVTISRRLAALGGAPHPAPTPATSPGESPDATPYATLDATPDWTPDATPHATPDATPDATPEATSDATPEATSDATRDAYPDSTASPTRPDPAI